MALELGLRDNYTFVLEVANGSSNGEVTLNFASNYKTIIFENSFSFVLSKRGVLLTNFYVGGVLTHQSAHRVTQTGHCEPPLLDEGHEAGATIL